MAEFVLDSSVALSWCFPHDPTEDTPYSRHVLTKLSVDDAIVPAVWPFEIANIIFVAFQKRKRSTQKDIDDYLQLLRALPIRVEYRDLWDTIALEVNARKWNLSAYDAAYLDLAWRRSLPLATADVDLRRIAIAEGVKVL